MPKAGFPLLRSSPHSRRFGQGIYIPPAGGGTGDGGLDLPPPTNLGTDFRNYISQTSPHVIVVPNGVYNVGDGILTNATHSSPLVLVAETQGGVVIDMTTSSAGLTHGLNMTNVTNVIFVGINFFMGSLTLQACNDLNWWWMDFQYPDFTQMTLSHIPRFFRIFGGGVTTQIGIYGSDLHNGNATIISTGSFTSGVTFQGGKMYDVTEHAGSDPDNVSHLDVMNAFGPGVSNFTFADVYIIGGGRYLVQSSAKLDDTNGSDIPGMVWRNFWYTQATGVAFQYHVDAAWVINGSRQNGYSWGHLGAGVDRIDYVNHTSGPPQWDTARINVPDTNVQFVQPSGIDPATTWRNSTTGQYNNWPNFFGITLP